MPSELGNQMERSSGGSQMSGRMTDGLPSRLVVLTFADAAFSITRVQCHISLSNVFPDSRGCLSQGQRPRRPGNIQAPHDSHNT